MKIINDLPVLPKAAGILKLKSYWLKRNSKAANTITIGFHMNESLKSTANSIEKSATSGLAQWLSAT
jgi:hypothetical protein